MTFIPLSASFSFKRIVENFDKPIIIGRATDIAESVDNLRFSSKVVSRQHAKIYKDGIKIFIQDIGSSSGTYVNGTRLSLQGQESKPCELHDNDIIKLGEDYNLSGVLHHCVIMKLILRDINDEVLVESESVHSLDYVDLSLDPEVRANVDNEFNELWTSLTSELISPFKILSEDQNLSTIEAINDTLQNPRYTTFLKYSLHSSEMEKISPTTRTYSSLHKASFPVVTPSTGNSGDTATPLPGISNSQRNRSATGKSSMETQKSKWNAAISRLSTGSAPPSVIKSRGKWTETAEVTNASLTQPITDLAQTKNVSADGVSYIKSQTWPSKEIQKLALGKFLEGDEQVMAFYHSLREHPIAFVSTVSKYIQTKVRKDS